MQKQMDKGIIIKKDFKIKDDQDLGQSVVILTRANNRLAELEAERKRITAPMREALNEVMSRYKPLTDELTKGIETIRKEQSRYQTALIQTRLAEEKKIADRIGDGCGKISLEKAVEKIRHLDEVVGKIEVDGGSLSFSSKEEIEIMDLDILIEKTGSEFIEANMDKIKLAKKEGIELPGCRYYTIAVPRNNRNG